MFFNLCPHFACIPRHAATLSEEEREEAGCTRLPTNLATVLDLFETGDPEFAAAFDEAVGCTTLRQAYIAVKRSEAAVFEGKSLEEEALMLHARF